MPSSAHDPAGKAREPGPDDTEELSATTSPGTARHDPGVQHDLDAQHDADAARGAGHRPPAALPTMTARHWWVPVLAGVGGYVGTVVGIVIALVLSILGLALQGDSDEGSTTDRLNGEISNATGLDTDTSGLRWILSVPFQLAAMAALVPLRLILSFGGEGASAGITVPQYFALACGILTAWLIARKLSTRMRVETRGVQWLMAAVSGLTWAALALVVTALTVLRLDVPFFASDIRVRLTALGGGLFPVLFLVGLLSVAAALNVRSTQVSPGRIVIGAERSTPGVLQVLRPIAVQFSVFGTVAGLGLLIYAFVEGGAPAGFSALFWLPIAVGWLFVLSLLSALTAGGAATSLTGLTGRSDAFYLWSEGTVPVWAVVLCILLALVSAVCAAITWAHVRPLDARVARTPLAWTVLPVTYFLLGLLALWLLRVGGYASGGMVGSSNAVFSLRPAGWTCLVFLVWGVIIELLARLVVPAFMHTLPRRVTRGLRGSERSRGRAAVVASAAAMGGAGLAGAGLAGVGTRATPAPEAPVATSSAQHPSAEPTATTALQDATAAYSGPHAGSGDETRVLPSYDDPGATTRMPAQRAPMDPATKKRIRLIAIIVGTLILLAVLATVVFSVLSRTVFGPDNQAEDLLRSVTDGNATHAAEIANPNVSSGQRALLTDDVYGATQNRISSYEIKDTTIDGDRATVNATVTQDGVTTPVALPMVSDSRDGLFKSWRVDESAGVPLYQALTVEVPAGVGELDVNGKKVSVDTQGQPHTVEYTVLPGDYAVGVSSSSKYVTYGGNQVAEIRAGSPSSAPVMSFQPSFTPALEEDLTKQLNATLDRCAQSTEFEPEGCPFGYSIYGDDEDYRNPRWSIQRYPTYSVSSYGNQATFTTDRSGEVRLDYQYNEEYDDEPADWTDRDTTSSVSGYGTVSVSGDELTINAND